VQHVLDADRSHGSPLKRGQQHAAQGIAKGQTEAALKRFGDEGRAALRIGRLDLEALGFFSSCQFLILTDMEFPGLIECAGVG
jgi:hypothetical protein